MPSPTSLLITGASSGIGAALALAYAEPGRALALGGRSAARLAEVAEACRRRGASVTVSATDITERDAIAGWIEATAAASPEGRLDLVIANAGISSGTGGRVLESAEQTRRIFAVNLDGVINTVLPAVAVMRRQDPSPTTAGRHGPRRGQIAIVSSLVGFRGLPGVPAYSASKAAVKAWGEGLRGALSHEGIAVSVVCPGFVRTPMTDGNPYRMPFLMDADRAALIVKHGLARERARIAFPWPTYAAAWLASVLPPSWIDPLLTRLPKKPATTE